MQSLEELSREIESIRQEIREGAAKFVTPEAFYEFRKSFLDNKSGKIGHLMKEIDPIIALTPYLMPMRCDAQVFSDYKLDFEKID